MSDRQLKAEIEGQLERAGLLSVVDSEQIDVGELPDGRFADIVLNDAGKEDEVRRALSSFGTDIDLRIHPVWRIEGISDPQIVVSPSGGLTIARLVGVTLKSGSVQVEVQVAVTYLAEMELERVFGTKPDKEALKRLAREYVENRLQWGGRYWDPRRYPRLEIAADRALSLYRSLQKTA